MARMSKGEAKLGDAMAFAMQSEALMCDGLAW